MSTELSSILLTAAAPLQNLDREPFFCAVLEELAGVQVGPGSLSRACREAQRTILSSRPPILSDGPHPPSKYGRVRRSPFVQAC